MLSLPVALPTCNGVSWCQVVSGNHNALVYQILHYYRSSEVDANPKQQELLVMVRHKATRERRGSKTKRNAYVEDKQNLTRKPT